MEFVAIDLDCCEVLIGDDHAFRIVGVVEFGANLQAAARLGAGDEVDDDLMTTSGRPRQSMVMNENRRCSILFHLRVPGGKWQTRMSKPVSWASRLSSSFHKRKSGFSRDQLL